MTVLCWKQNLNGKHCKNYRLSDKQKCRHHVDKDNFVKVYLYIFFMSSLVFMYYQYILNQSYINLHIYMSVNNFCKNINDIGYNTCMYLENYTEKYNQIIYELDNLEIYINRTIRYLAEYFKMYDNFLFNYTMKNIHDFIFRKYTQ